MRIRIAIDSIIDSIKILKYLVMLNITVLFKAAKLLLAKMLSMSIFFQVHKRSDSTLCLFAKVEFLQIKEIFTWK